MCLRKREQRGAGEGKKRVERGEKRGRSGVDSQAQWKVPEGREQKDSLPLVSAQCLLDDGSMELGWSQLTHFSFTCSQFLLSVAKSSSLSLSYIYPHRDPQTAVLHIWGEIQKEDVIFTQE